MNMNIYLEPVNPGDSEHVNTLFDLLHERTKDQSISHTKMPGYIRHCKFVQSRPYRIWFLIRDLETKDIAGSVYLTKQNEIGIFVFKKYQGRHCGPAAVRMLMQEYKGPFLANINPRNPDSIKMFVSLGFELLQVTYNHE